MPRRFSGTGPQPRKLRFFCHGKSEFHGPSRQRSLSIGPQSHGLLRLPPQPMPSRFHGPPLHGPRLLPMFQFGLLHGELPRFQGVLPPPHGALFPPQGALFPPHGMLLPPQPLLFQGFHWLPRFQLLSPHMKAWAPVAVSMAADTVAIASAFLICILLVPRLVNTLCAHHHRGFQEGYLCGFSLLCSFLSRRWH